MAQDPEVKAMSSITTVLAPLDDDARARVLEWAAKRHGFRLVDGSADVASEGEQVPDDAVVELAEVAHGDRTPTRRFANSRLFLTS